MKNIKYIVVLIVIAFAGFVLYRLLNQKPEIKIEWPKTLEVPVDKSFDLLKDSWCADHDCKG